MNILTPGQEQWVRRQSARLHSRYADVDDLLQEARIAAFQAEQSHDAARSTSRTWRISQIRYAVLHAMRSARELSRWNYARYVAGADLPVWLLPAVDLDAPHGDEEGTAVSLAELLTDPAPELCEQVWGREQQGRLAWACQHLPAREARVLREYYHEQRTFREIGARLGVGESRAYQLHAQALKRLRVCLGVRKGETP